MAAVTICSDKDLNIRPISITLTEKNIGETFFDIGCRNIFLGQSPKAKDIKAKINRWDFIKLKWFCLGKETINKTKRHLWTERNICKWCDPQGVNMQTMWTGYTTQYQ